MNYRLFKNIAIIGLCLTFTFVYYRFYTNNNDEEVVNSVFNYQTIVLKDKNDTLVPVEIDMQIEGEDEQIFRNMLYLMQSNDFEDIGLYPVFSDKLEINKMEIVDSTLIFDFNDNLYVNNNQEALDIFETLSFVFCRDQIENIELKIDGNDITFLPNSTIPTSCLTKQLGINNFDADTNNIYKTVPVVVYNQQTIKGKTYYIPTTTRIEVDNNDLDKQVSLLLEKLEYDKPIRLIDNSSLENGILKVNIDSNILFGNETIDSTLYQQLILSLSSINGVREVSILIDNEVIVPTNNVGSEINNRVKI